MSLIRPLGFGIPPLELNKEFQLYNVYHSYEPPGGQGSGLGAFYDRGAGVNWNGKHTRIASRGGGVMDVYKAVANKALATAKHKIIPVLKTGLATVAGDVVRSQARDVPALIDSFRHGGAKGVFNRVLGRLPYVVGDAIHNVIPDPRYDKFYKEQGSGWEINKEAYSHLARTTITNLMPYLKILTRPLLEKLEWLEKLAEAYQNSDNDKIEEALDKLAGLASQHPLIADEDLLFLYRIVESMIDVALYSSQYTMVNYPSIEASPAEPGGFLPILAGLAAPILGAIIPKVASALAGKIGNAARDVVAGIGGEKAVEYAKKTASRTAMRGLDHMMKAATGSDFLKNIKGSGFDPYSAIDRNATESARNLALTISLNVPGGMQHLRHGNVSVLFPGLSALGHNISNSEIANEIALPLKMLESLKKVAAKSSTRSIDQSHAQSGQVKFPVDRKRKRVML